MLHGSHVSANFGTVVNPDADGERFGVYSHSSAIPDLPVHGSTGGGAAATEPDFTAEDALQAALQAAKGRATRLASKWW